ncbi:MAG: carboxymuconolactone decarboxylase family protein [Bacteriovorax sp.]|nr:carboxymuconolactone decarboxylase family protein [Rhizobacter sp.]
MASIPYADTSNPNTAPLVKRIMGERGRLPNRCGVSIYNPPVAQGWLAFLTASSKNCSLFDRRRELSILRVAVINGADPEIRARTPFASAEIITVQQIDSLREGRDGRFSDVARAVPANTDAMTRAIHVPQAIFGCRQDVPQRPRDGRAHRHHWHLPPGLPFPRSDADRSRQASRRPTP